MIVLSRKGMSACSLGLIIIISSCVTEQVKPWQLNIVSSILDNETYYADISLSSVPLPPHVDGYHLYSELNLILKNKTNRTLYFLMSDIVILTDKNERVLLRNASHVKPSGAQIYRIMAGERTQFAIHTVSTLTESYSIISVDFGDSLKQNDYAEMYRTYYPGEIKAPRRTGSRGQRS